MTHEEQEALTAIKDILARLTRIETRLCKLMIKLDVDPTINDGYAPSQPPRPIRYWEDS